MLDISTYRELKKKVLIKESYEEMIEIGEEFLRYSPHPYESLGAPYKGKSPFFLRKSVLKKLLLASKNLELIHKGYKLKIFDAYRPLDVQKFMINYDTNRMASEMFGTSFGNLNEEKQVEVKKIITHFWSPISKNIELNPPPHSTGAALDLTIVDANGITLDMGTKIDELSEKSASDYFKNSNTVYEKNRELLVGLMCGVGFTQLPTEWWHFSYGDQIWAVDEADKNKTEINAQYGMV